MLASLAVIFGRVGEGVGGKYTIGVNFPNAAGLLDGASVLMAGAKVGRVAGGPEVLPDGTGVRVWLTIYEPIEIATDARVQVGSSGLLGDRFVDVQPPTAETKEFLQPDAIIQGKREAGMSDLAKDGADLVADLRQTVAKLDAVLTTVKTEVLDEASTKNLRETFANLKTASAGFSESTGKLSATLDEASAAMSSFKKVGEDMQPVVDGAKKAVDQASGTMIAVGRAADEAVKTLQRMSALLEEARKGQGAFGALLSDPGLKEDLQSLIGNLRRHGVLFYRDQEPGEAATPRPPATSSGPRNPR